MKRYRVYDKSGKLVEIEWLHFRFDVATTYSLEVAYIHANRVYGTVYQVMDDGKEIKHKPLAHLMKGVSPEEVNWEA